MNKCFLTMKGYPKEESQDLIIRLKRGEREAFEHIYEQYHQQLYAVAWKYLREVSLAEDAIHDVFLKLWTHRARLKEDHSLTSWLATAMRNHVLNQLRNEQRRTAILQKIKEEMGKPLKTVATGGLSFVYAEKMGLFDVVAPELTLNGLYEVWKVAAALEEQ